jgi:hypothetical protein
MLASRAVAKTVIVTDETVRQLIEAYASMAAWFYQMSEVLRRANLGVEPPSDGQRAAYVAQVASLFPEVSAVAQTLKAPRPYIPPPAIAAPVSVTENEGVEIKAPPADLPQADLGPAPPPMVDPNKVRY